MKLRKLLVTAIVFVYLLPTAANGDFDYPKLPWYEKYLFPIGSWTSPENDGIIKPWLTANNIDIWEPQDYFYIVSMNHSVENYLHSILMTRTVYTCFYHE